MADIRIRKNEVCVIGLPQCNYIFSSTNSCFIAYGFDTSGLEKDVITALLIERGIEPVEAGNRIQPGQFAYCTKICSKIITSRFCIVLLNEDVTRLPNNITITKPNANVNIEYGQMIGFNKFIIPFQHENFPLPFNVNGLDTIKYNDRNFRERAIAAIDEAIARTIPAGAALNTFIVILEKYLLLRNALIAKVADIGERSIYEIGASCEFNLLTSLDGLLYLYFGNFASLPNDKIKWRINKLHEIVQARRFSIPRRVATGSLEQGHADIYYELIDALKMWILVSDNERKNELIAWYKNMALPYELDVFTVDEVIEAAGEL